MGQTGSVLLEMACSVVSLLTLQKGVMNVFQSHMAACAWQEPWGPRRPSASWLCPAGVVDHCWSSWLALSLALDVYFVFFFHMCSREKILAILSLSAVSLCVLEKEQSIASVYKLFIMDVMGGLLWII